jgi:hypothetical protein
VQPRRKLLPQLFVGLPQSLPREATHRNTHEIFILCNAVHSKTHIEDEISSSSVYRVDAFVRVTSREGMGRGEAERHFSLAVLKRPLPRFCAATGHFDSSRLIEYE